MKSIVHLLPGKANPNTLNGVNKVVHSLASTQKLKGNNVVVYGVANNTIIRHESNYVLKLFIKNRIGLIPPFKLISELNKLDRSSIIHLHSAFISWFPILTIILRIIGFKFVLTPHGAYTPNNLRNSIFKILYFYCIDSIVLKLANKIQVIGKTEFNKYSKSFLSGKSIYIPNGCNPRDVISTKIQDHLSFGYMGRLKMDHKGLDLLLIGFADYVKSGGRGNLFLAGDGPDKNNLINMTIKLGIENKISFVGVLFDKEKDLFLKKSNFFIHSSRWEGYPMGCLEAIACSTPLIISEETNMGDIVKEYGCGLVLLENNCTEITNTLFKAEKLFFFDTEYKSMKNGCVKVVKEQLSWDAIEMKIKDELYN